MTKQLIMREIVIMIIAFISQIIIGSIIHVNRGLDLLFTGVQFLMILEYYISKYYD